MWGQVVWYNLFSVVFFVLGCSLLILSLPLLKLGSKSTCLCSGFCVRRPRQYSVISWEFDIFWGFFCFFLVHCLGRWSQWMCLLCNRMRGILTQGPAPDPKCKLNISSSSHFHIHYTASFVPRISWSLCCYCKWWGRSEGWEVAHLCLGGGIMGRYHIFNTFFCFSVVVNCSFMDGTW